jgi:CheY-like chemotaxis protein
MFSDKKGKSHQVLEEAEDALIQATNLTKQLLTFSKGGEPLKRLVSLPPILRDSVKFALSGSRSNAVFEIVDDLWPVEADEGQISQVIHNIVLNARDAMPEGGTVSVEARNMVVDEKSGVSLASGKFVRIAIKDSGMGIPDQDIPKIFDPYFTTKERGSGLGLATSYSIVKRHGGVIDVQSARGAGSTFFIYLPASGDRVPDETVRTKSVERGTGRILVMDDEEILRTVVGRMLRSLGYEVDFAENGDQATVKYAAAMHSDSPFDAVILDLTVRGGMGGREAIGRLLAIDPDIRAVVSSGYSEGSILSDYSGYGFMAVLPKPYNIETLGKTLKKLMRANSA